MGRAFFPRYALLVFVFVVVAVTIIVPLIFVVFDGFFITENGKVVLTIEFLKQVTSEARYWTALTNTAIVALCSTACSVVIGVALAWVLVRTNAPNASLLENFAIVPIFIPPFVGAFAWILLAAPRIGLFNLVLKLSGFGEPLDIYSYAGISWVIGIYLAPYVMMIVASALRSMDPSLEEAGQISGLSRTQTALKITLPLISPAILSGGILAFVITIGLFGTPVLLGWSKQILLITSRIYIEWQQVPPAYGVIAVLSVYLILFSVAAMLVQRIVLRGRSFITVTGKGYRSLKIKLGPIRFVYSGAIWLYLALTVFAPLAVMLVASISTYTWSGVFTLRHLSFLWTSNDVAETLSNSLIVTVVAATLTTAFGICIAWIISRTSLRGRRFLEYLVLLPISIPGIAFAIGVAFFWLRFGFGIYGTMWIIVLAFLGKYVSYAVRTISSSLLQVHPELEECARVSGYGRLKTLWKITLPLVRPSIVSSWIMLYSIFLTELSMVTILHTTETRTFSILTFNTWYNGQFSLVASLSLLQLIIGVLVMFFVHTTTGGVGKRE